MDYSVFDAWTRRRFGSALTGVAFAVLGPISRNAFARKKKKGKPCKNCCRANGAPCKKTSAKCKAKFCLNVPFTIEANWTADHDNDSVLFVPPENDATGPSPFIFFNCTADVSTCEDSYPFACMSGDAITAGSEIATIFKLLPGTYEYWHELDPDALAGEVTIVLKDNGGRVIRQWVNLADGDPTDAWHVFDIDGKTGLITSFDEQLDGGVPEAAHEPNTEVCPFI